MKRRNFLVLLLATFALTGCSLFDALFPKKDPSGEEEQKQTVINGEFYGGITETGNYRGYEFSKFKEEQKKPTSGVGEVDIYAFNDFHGAILESKSEPGLKRLGTFFKEKSQNQNTLIFDQGDTWQGTFESNYEYGTLIQDVFNYANVSLRTLGNHDFDWGLNKLEEVANRKFEDEYIPSLGANVFDFANGLTGSEQQYKYGREYSTFVLDNGLKVGVVGVIGEDQWTSICSTYVENIVFTHHIEKIKEISDFLRIEKECDIVVASTHESSSDMVELGNSVTVVSPVSNKRYVDLVLGGHSHYDQKYEINGVPFVQWSANGSTTGHVTLKYDFSTSSVLDSQTTINTYNCNYMKYYYSNIDPKIDEMVDSYLNRINEIGDEVLSTNFSGSFDTTALARLMSEAIFKRVSSSFSDLKFAISYYARNEFSGSTFTYRDLYRCFPFDNRIIILNVSSYYGVTSITYYYSYREDTSLTPEHGKTYRCAIVDYIALHKNTNRQFDKFPDAKSYMVYSDDNGYSPNYREILYDYLKANKDKVFAASNYQSDSPHFIKYS